ncbi:cupredoxin domain-containing protein [Patiriisocius hiemis]|uniref:Cupredoxin domain-containing protein n=1 Tax=Patiriisocius hiemis TaxID=3075604 RepID=A0ABU2YB23_9FLAO|nr:cupredoxin domain-containing protein [Constantimarinum sp. W242]MDT0555397.1 cupredoxin domain-containing protein [Constantimarinum sp. W242]
MKKVITIIVALVSFSFATKAQDKMTKDRMDKAPKVISFEQTKGEFTQKKMTLKAGTYVFEVSNNNAAPKVGLVLVPKGKDTSNPDNHIKTAYVTKAVEKGKTESSQATTLDKGEYVYFCPLNPTPQYTLTVE